jgi:Flp pilus assembly protein TadD
MTEHALKIDPNSSDAHNLKGMVLTQAGRFEEALDNFNKGLSLKSNDAFLLNNRGFVHLINRRLTDALQDIDESIVINPENPWAYRNKAIYYFFFWR